MQESSSVQSQVDSSSELQTVCQERLQSLFDSGLLFDKLDVYQNRLDHEIKVYKTSGYADLILIIREYTSWAKANGVVVGPGRGSAAGSLVVFLCGITTIDPIRFGLIFERFLNPERISLPDIDSDFSDRDAVIEHLKQKYGSNRVAKVGVPSLFKPRSSIDEFAKILKVDYGETKRITKLIGDAKTFDEAFSNTPELYEYEKKYAELFKLARIVQGLVRQTTTHPSAVILTMKPIGAEIPMQRAPGEAAKDGELVTGWDGEELDSLGYVKLDILTIDNLTVIDKTIRMLPVEIGSKIDFYNLPIDDAPTLLNFQAGHTVGVFQFEEPKSVGILQAIQGIKFADVYAVNALIRPGLDVKAFLDNRNNPAQAAYAIPQLEAILKDSCGVILYQEQVMRICVELAGFSMAKADKVRKIIAKTANQRSDKGLVEVFEEFKAGYEAKGLDKNQFDTIWNSILACQNYVFNLSHASCYGYIAYADMYLKTHYPLQFMCAALQVRSREIYIKECERLKIDVLQPDVNKSELDYSIEGSAIRIGLSCIKHIGSKANAIIARRPFADEFDFITRVKLSKAQTESLIYAGALDCFDTRKNLVGRFCKEELRTEVTLGDIANGEKESLGFYFKFDPLGGFEHLLSNCVTLSSKQPQIASVGGLITKIRMHDAKTGTMCFATIISMDGEIDIVSWPSDYKIDSQKLIVGNVIIAKGKKTDRGNYAVSSVSVLKEGQ